MLPELDLLLIEKSLFVKPDKARELAATRMPRGARRDRRLACPPPAVVPGYPDRGVLRLPDRLPCDALHFSTFTGAAAVPYPGRAVSGPSYTGENLERDL